MTSDDLADRTGPLTRREARRATAEVAVVADATDATDADAVDDLVPPDTSAAWADSSSLPTALTWIDVAAVEAGTRHATLDAETTVDEDPDLLADAPRRGILRPGYLIPLGTLVVLAGSYTATTLLWPLHEVPPVITAAEFEPVGADPAVVAWPAQGSAAIGAQGMGVTASATAAAPIASIAKVVSVMMVLDRLPLQPGEQGPSYSFTRADSREYLAYSRDNQSALDVPVGGQLTEYQMLQGTLLGSANNYIDRLSDEIWGSDEAFAAAAKEWLQARGLEEISIVTPSGRNSANAASPESLIRLGEIAMANPVFAEIVGTASVELPGAGLVRNSNGLLADPGFIGVKTGTLGGEYNLLSAKEVIVGETTVRLFASVLGQDDNEARLAVSRALYAEVEAALLAQKPAVASGTVVGQVTTEWGSTVDLVTDTAASVVLWNAALPTTDVVFDLGDERDSGQEVGTLTVTGPLDSAEITVSLADDIDAPSAWWRLTHPMELFGIDE